MLHSVKVTVFSNSEEVEVDKVNVSKPSPSFHHTLRLSCLCNLPLLSAACVMALKMRRIFPAASLKLLHLPQCTWTCSQICKEPPLAELNIHQTPLHVGGAFPARGQDEGERCNLFQGACCRHCPVAKHALRIIF